MFLYNLMYFDANNKKFLPKKGFMPQIEVKHREDHLLQEHDEELSPSMKETYIGRVTIPHQAMALKFLNAVIIGQKFENENELAKALKTWPEFAKDHGLEVDSGWDSIDIYNNSIAFAGSLGGPFVIGIIEQLNNL